MSKGFSPTVEVIWDYICIINLWYLYHQWS